MLILSKAICNYLVTRSLLSREGGEYGSFFGFAEKRIASSPY
ncbi:MAG: hypothetical protein U5L45_10875 [Saprospiraceae bacterium]|nr:hypothetical protein [Saprospiraceae bacterium]